MLSFHARCPTVALHFVSRHSIRNLATSGPRAKAFQRIPTKITTPAPAVTVEKSRSQRTQAVAARILKSGQNEVYNNTASNGLVGTSLMIMALSYCGIGYIYSTRLWDNEKAKARGLHWAVPLAYQITMIAWGGFAAYALTRTIGIVKSIKLIKSGDKILLETLVRRPVPFMKAERLLNDPQTLVISRAKLYGSAYSEGLIVGPEGTGFMSKVVRTLFYTPFYNTRKAMGGVGLVPIQVGETGSQRHLIIDSDGQFLNGGQDLLDLSQDES